MAKYDALVEQHILEHETRLKHFDELLARAREGIGPGTEVSELRNELGSLEQERLKLVNHIEALKRKTHQEWQEETIEEAGPMILWEGRQTAGIPC